MASYKQETYSQQAPEDLNDLIGPTATPGWSTVQEAKNWLAPSAAIPDDQEIRRRQERLRQDSWAACLAAATRQVGLEESARLKPELRFWFIEGFRNSCENTTRPLQHGGETALASFRAGQAARKDTELMLKVEMCAHWLQKTLSHTASNGIG